MLFHILFHFILLVLFLCFVPNNSRNQNAVKFKQLLYSSLEFRNWVMRVEAKTVIVILFFFFSFFRGFWWLAQIKGFFLYIVEKVTTFNKTPTEANYTKCQRKSKTNDCIEKRNIWCTAYHMPLKLFFTLHEIEAKLTEVQLQTVIVFGWEWGEVPCLNLISS